MMFKKVLLLFVLLFVVTAVGCGEKKIVHCDKCGTEIEVDADSNMTEEWALFCEECGKDVESAAMDIIDK